MNRHGSGCGGTATLPCWLRCKCPSCPSSYAYDIDISLCPSLSLSLSLSLSPGKCDSVLSTFVGHIHENSTIYNTDAIIEMLEVLCYYGAKNEDILVPLGEELASRISSMPIHVQNKACHILQKLNLDHLMHTCCSLGTDSLVDDLKLKSESAKSVAHMMQFFKHKSWSTELEESLRHYVITNSFKLSLRDIVQMLNVIVEKEVATPDVLTALAKAVSNILMQDISMKERRLVWGRDYDLSLISLFWAFGKLRFYNEELFAAFATLVLGKPDLLLQSPHFFTALSWCCAKARFYSEPVMQSIAEYSLRNLTKFNHRDIGLLVYSFAALNCKHHDLLEAAIDKVLSGPSPIANAQVYWTIAWAAMVLEQYPVELLSQMLTDDYMKGTLFLVWNL